MLFLQGCAIRSQCYHGKQMKFFRRWIAVNTVLEDKTAIKTKDDRIVQFREPTEDDGKEMFRIVQESQVLDVNSSYSYLMWSKYFNKTSIIASCEDEVIGFVSGFLQPESPETLFVWQVAVDPKFQGNGLATKLIEQLIKQLDEHEGIHYLEATVTPSNIPSSKLFQGIAKKKDTECTISECFSEDQFPDPNHEAELTYRVGPFK